MENTQKSTLDILQEVSSEETNPYYDETTGLDLKPETKDEEETETKTDEVSETTEISQEYTMDDEDHLSFINENDDDDYELPTLDPSLAENPVLLKRAQEYEKGVKKLINRVKEKEAEMGNLQNLAEWNKVLSDPETVAPSLKHLVKNLASMYNLDVYDLYLGTVNDDTDDVSFVSEDYSTSSQADIDKLVEAKVNERLKAYEEDLGYVRQKKEKEQTEVALNNYVKSVSTKTISSISQTDNGWKITEDMIKTAVQNLPNLLNDPIKAVRSYYSDERLAHYQTLSRGKDKAPNLAPASSVVNYQFPTDKTKISALDILRQMQSE
jgi:hypothetical protein